MAAGKGQEVRYLEPQERRGSRELWEEAFPEDSRSFDDYYFEEKLKDNRILALCDNGRIDSMIHLNPYMVQAGGRRWRVDYLVGVATRKNRRHRGYMRRLLVQMMADMHAEEMPFCFLMPADEAIYRPFGFTFIYRQPRPVWKNEEELERRSLMPWRDSPGKRRYLEALAEWMNVWLEKRYQVYAVRDYRYLKRLIQELDSENGSLDVLYDGERMVGLESWWGLEKREPRLLYGEASYVEEPEEAKPAIMARIIAAEAFVRAIHLKEDVAEEQRTLVVKLEDPLIEANQGVWNWNFNHETSWLEPAESGSRMDLQLTITELTGWLFGYELPGQAEPYADMIETLHGVFLDEVV